jgi:hypothetical protein
MNFAVFVMLAQCGCHEITGPISGARSLTAMLAAKTDEAAFVVQVVNLRRVGNPPAAIEYRAAIPTRVCNVAVAAAISEWTQSGVDLESVTKEVAASGLVLEIGTTPSERVAPPRQIAPGRPPLLAFRYYEAQQRHRVSNSELMLDDAGH